MLTKVFSDAMGPCKVIPYYFRAKEEADSEEVTIATLVTHNRLAVLSRLATRYKGNRSPFYSVAASPPYYNLIYCTSS
jgi:hypothetical protein